MGRNRQIVRFSGIFCKGQGSVGTTAPVSQSSFRTAEASMLPQSIAILAAAPAASPIAMQIAITRYDACARCVPEMQRPATSRFSMPIGRKQR